MKKQKELTLKIESLEEDLKKLLDFKGKLVESVDEFKCFEEVVTQLVDESEHLSTTKDFMDKCDALSKWLVTF